MTVMIPLLLALADVPSPQYKGPATWLAGSDATCAVRDGAVYCWGEPLGLRDLGRHLAVPTRVPGLKDVDSVSLTDGSACAWTGSRAVCWGDNRWGELGDGTLTERHVPVQVKGLRGSIGQIAAGAHHTCAIVDGGVRCWGHGLYGQVGDGGSRTPVKAPVQVRGLTSGVTSIAVGIFHSCAVVRGRVKCWGMNLVTGVGRYPRDARTPVDAPVVGDDFVGVRASGGTTCAFGLDRTACWGEHVWSSPTGFGPVSDLAFEYHGGCAIRSGAVTCFTWDGQEMTTVPLPAAATQISVGTEHACALAGGEVYCWGNRGFGALGDGTPAGGTFDPTFIRMQPAPVAWPSQTP
jgi:alpha-tubulin suppressor-like RCC1 family protein